MLTYVHVEFVCVVNMCVKRNGVFVRFAQPPGQLDPLPLLSTASKRNGPATLAAELL